MNKTLFASIAATIVFSFLGMTTAFASTHIVHVKHNAYLRSAPYLHSHAIALEKSGSTLTLESGGNRFWWHVRDQNGRTGYVTKSKYYTVEVNSQRNTVNGKSAATLVNNQSQPQDKIHVTAGNGVPVTINLLGDTLQQRALIKAGLTQLGVPYKWGTQKANFGFDCSNFTAWMYKQIGISFSGSSVYQRYHVGTPVSLNRLQVGDLLFFATPSNSTGAGHVGMYIGGGLLIQEGGGRGKVTVESLNNNRAWFGRSLVFARSVLH